MTSTANQPAQVPAPSTTAPSATSYASAAGAAKKPASGPVIVAGTTTSPAPSASTQNPVVVSSNVVTPPIARTPSGPATNGRSPFAPALPTVVSSSLAPVVHGSSNINGGTLAHGRNSSVTISSAAVPSNYVPNGGPVGGRGKPDLVFGSVSDSPAAGHSSPQVGGSAPIPIPGSSAPRVPSPAQSPSPIPMPSASGGRPPSGVASTSQMTFGSFQGDGDRPPRQPSQTNIVMNQPTGAHLRKDSSQSAQGDVGGHGGSLPGRGGFQNQLGRNRPNYNTPAFTPSMGGYPGPRNPSGPHNPRGGGMPGYGHGRGGMPNYSQSPRNSPALPPSIPTHSGTPTMAPAMPPMQGPGQPFYPAMQQPYNQFPGFPPPPLTQPYDPGMQRPPSMQYGGGYSPMGYLGNPATQSPGPVYVSPYGPGPQYTQGPQPGTQPMSRNPSQVSTDRPSSTAAQGPGNLIASGTTQPPAAPANASGSSNFVRPKRKNAAIVIKNAQGEAINLHELKAPASPVPSIQQSKTPPIIASTPTPPPKPSTPLHQRTDSAAHGKSTEQVRREFQEQVLKSTGVSADTTVKDEPTASETAIEKEGSEAKATVQEETPAPSPTQNEPLAAPANGTAEVKSTEPAEDKPTATAASAAPEPEESEEDRLERMIREMDEEDARREKEQAEITARKNKEREEAKKKADPAENDRKLRDQEREMERLEEEREKRREAAAKSGTEVKPKSVADLLAQKVSDLSLSDSKDSTPSSPGLDADKPEGSGAATPETGSLAPVGDSEASTAPKAGATEKARSKPAALNLTPLNTKPVEPPQPSAALQSLKSARFLSVMDSSIYPAGVLSPNPAVNAAVARKGKTFKYDAQFLLQFQKVFTEQPSLEFGQQVKTLIGDSDGSRSASSAARAPGAGSGRQNSKPGASGFPAMGSFGAPPPGKPLPPGTTSAERFAMSQGQMPRPINPMASFGRGGVFPGGSQMARTPSSSNMGNIMPHSPRQGSRSTRGGASKRSGYDGKSEAQAAKTMPLTQGLELKPIVVSATGWKPTSVGNRAGANATAPNGQLDPEMVQRKVKAALNKMTPENFDKISDQILVIAGQSVHETDGRTLRQVIQLTFEKATDESHWASMYAKFCKRMLDTMNPDIKDVTIKDKAGNLVSGGALFRKYLLNRCQEEFERGWKSSAQEKKDDEDEVANSTDTKKPGEVKLLSDEYYTTMKSKRQGLGLVQFIGELYKLSMLTERIMHECVRKLLEFTGIPDEAEIESLTKLLRTIGFNLDQTEKGRPMMDAYFTRIQSIIAIEELPSRLKYMLMDIVDLRKANWTSKDSNKGPKTLDEVRAEAEAQAAQKAAEAARSSQRGPPGGRSQGGRGDARNFSNYNQPAPNQVGMDDLRRLKGSASRTASSNVTLGPTSMFSSRSNSGRARFGPGGALARAGEESGNSSRTGTPPTRERETTVAHTNAFGLLADTGENPASPPSTAASPSLAKVAPDPSVAAATEEKKEA